MVPIKVQARLSIPDRNRSLAEKFAAILTNLGLTVQTISDRGVSFAGDKQDLERIFKSPIQSHSDKYTFDAPPQLPTGIPDEGASVYLPTKPSFYSRP